MENLKNIRKTAKNINKADRNIAKNHLENICLDGNSLSA